MSLLAHLYSRIKGSQEDVATFSLQYIISSSEKLNSAFNRLLSDSLNINIEPDVTYSCQSVGENSERPDMSGVNREGKELVLCEMKFYAGLTANQPNGYLNRLIKEGGEALVFVCPEQRRTSLWSKVMELCREDGKIIFDEADYRANVNGIAMSIITWAEIIETLRRTASSAVPESLPDIAQLAGFCEMMDSTAFIPFSSEDMGPEIARREERYYQVIDRLYDSLTANKQINATGKGLKASANRSGYTRYLKIGMFSAALIYNRTAWMHTNTIETPFWFYICDDGWNQSDTLKAKMRAIPEYEREIFDNTIGLALHPLLDAQLDEIANDMMNQILRFLNEIQSQ
ncbi:MAG: hypothetical protein IKG39_11905 [Lachnospiraceae bacterium]|nr:hypothetical protein [Lachnospiraceae bacterium]